MKFTETVLAGVYLIDCVRLYDERGFFARTWCQKEFAAHRLNPNFVQCNLSVNFRAGTLRGLHYQASPHEEAKLIQCLRGSIYDVVLDLRPESNTFGKWMSAILSEQDTKLIYIPEGCAHGFQCLENDTQLLYQMSQFYSPEAARGIRWNDPELRISWPMQPTVISQKDQTYPLFSTLSSL